MKAIIIKVNEKVIGVSKIDEITTKQFLDLQKDVANASYNYVAGSYNS